MTTPRYKGSTRVRPEDGTIWRAELHWYEAHGIGKKELKIKRLMNEAYERSKL
jgi:hypothetical protein